MEKKMPSQKYKAHILKMSQEIEQITILHFLGAGTLKKPFATPVAKTCGKYERKQIMPKFLAVVRPRRKAYSGMMYIGIIFYVYC